MDYIDTFASHTDISQDRKNAWYMAVSILLLAAKDNAPMVQLAGNRAFGNFPWEVLLDREMLDEFFLKNRDFANNVEVQAVLAKAYDLWQWLQKQMQIELPALWKEIKCQCMDEEMMSVHCPRTKNALQDEHYVTSRYGKRHPVKS